MDIVSYLLGKNSVGGGGDISLQEKDITITENKLTQVTADSGYDGLSKVNITTNVPSASEYFNTNILIGSDFGKHNIKKIPPLTIDNTITNLANYFSFWEMKEIENISGGDNVTTFNSFLSLCKPLEKVGFNNFNTSSATNMYSMFNTCQSLTSLDLSSFNTSAVTTMAYMFNGCAGLTSLDLSNFYTLALTDVSGMFGGCTSLTHLDIRNMTFDSVTASTAMFGNGSISQLYVPANCEIIVKSQTEKEWITTNFPRMTNVKTVAEL